MTIAEVPNFLDTLLMPFETEKLCIAANKQLSNTDHNILCQVVVDFEAQNEQYNVDVALQNISSIMNNFVKKAGTTGQTKIVINPDAMPFLVKQVLFYVAAMCKACKMSGFLQSDIINTINHYGVPISHNFYSRMSRTPNIYLKMVKYVPPIIPIGYMGQKHGELASAIKNLAYQCGKYDVYVDLFGGSGAASVALEKRNGSKYVYNELHRGMNTLFSVIADDNCYKELIQEIEKLQDDLDGKKDWLTNINFQKEMDAYYQSKSKPDAKETDILNQSILDFEFTYDDIVKYMQRVRHALGLQNNKYVFNYDGGKYSKTKLLSDIFPLIKKYARYQDGFAAYMSFINNYRLVVAVARDNFVPDINGHYENGKQMSVYDHDLMQKQLRAYMYYAYFENLLNKAGVIQSKDKVRYALAEIYHWSFVTSGKPGVSSILRYIYKGGVQSTQAPSNDIDKFISLDFRRIISALHTRVKGIIIENDDCVNVINKYEHGNLKYKHPLFYSDSPYLGTADYNDEVNGVPAFGKQDMRRLILALKNSGDKFIFSCRAAEGSSGGSKTTDKLIKGNKLIFEFVFNVFLSEFEEQGQSLWVLAIENGGTLANLVKSNKIAEIMITNFEICDFVDQSFPKVNFKVYTFYDFLKILVNNANV